MYGSVAAADTYHQLRGRADWAALTPDQKAAALTVASTYLDAYYEEMFIGDRTGGIQQEAAWPRMGPKVASLGLDDATIPNLVINATYELAYYEGMNPGRLFQFYDPITAVKSETVGPISTEYAVPTASGGSDPSAIITGAVGGMLSPLLTLNIPGHYALVV